MKIQQHRNLVQSLTTEAVKIRTRLLEELQAEVNLTPAEAEAIQWTGELRVFGQSVWHLFKTPGSWNGVTYYRLSVTNNELKSREVEDAAVAPAPRYDLNAAWKFVVDSYDGMPYSPVRAEWSDAGILEFVADNHFRGLSAFLVQPEEPTGDAGFPGLDLQG